MISVIITVYNVADFIREAVTSALAQTYRDIEVIVIDDGSTDGSIESLRDLDDSRLRIIPESHAGSAAARNTGLRLASGNMLAFLDGDDRWAPHNLERQLAFLNDHPEVDMTFGHSLVIDERGRSLGFLCSSFAGPLSFSDLLRQNHVGNGSCVLIRRAALDCTGWFDPILPACITIDLWLRLAGLRPGNIVAIPEVLIFYRRRKGQISADWRQMESAFLQVLARARRLEPELTTREENRSRAGRYRYYAGLARETDEPGIALRLLAIALCWTPLRLASDSRTWLLALAILGQLLLPRSWYERAVRWGQRLLGPLYS